MGMVVTRFWALWMALALLLFAETALAAVPISQIKVTASPGEDEAKLRELSGLRVGEPYRPADVRRAVKLLYELGRFLNVKVYAGQDARGVTLRIDLQPRPKVQEITIVDSGPLSEDELRRELGLEIGDDLDPEGLPDKHRQLTGFLKARGYRDAVVGILPKVVDKAGGRELLVRIEAGLPTRLRRSRFEGDLVFKVDALLRGSSLAPGEVLSESALLSAQREIKRYYQSRGYLDVEVQPPKLEFAEMDRSRADLRWVIHAGAKVSLKIRGNRLIHTAFLMEDAAPVMQSGSSPSALADAREQMLNRYRIQGFWQARVATAVRKRADGSEKQLLFSIHEGPRASVASLRFPGNQSLPESLLEETVHRVVRLSMGEAANRPGVNPALMDEMLGNTPGQPSRFSPQPVSAPPNPRRIYLENAYQVARESLADLYRSKGYHSVELGDPQIEARLDGQLLDVAMPVQEGIQWRLRSLSFSGQEALSAFELWTLAGLQNDDRLGVPLNYDAVEAARRAILSEYKDRGYLYVRVHESLVMAEAPGSEPLRWEEASERSQAVRERCGELWAEGERICPVELAFFIEEGPLVTTQDIIMRGVNVTQSSVVERVLTIRSGTTLRESDMEETRDSLLRLGIFERVEVAPIDSAETAPEKDVVISVKERKRFSLELRLGASTKEGARLFAGFGDANLFGSALQFQSVGRVNIWLPQLLVLYDETIRPSIETFYNSFGTTGRIEYEVALGLSSPRIIGLPAGFSAGLDVIALRDYDPAYAENAQLVSLVTSYKGLKPILAGAPRQLSFQLRIAYEQSELQCNPLITNRPELCSSSLSDVSRVSRLEGQNQYLTAGPHVSWDLRDDPLDPNWGGYFEFSSSYAWGLDRVSPDLTRVGGRAIGYLPLVPRLQLSVSAQVDKVFPMGSAKPGDVPLNKRLFLGGRSTIRGYAERTLLPQDTPLDPATGRPLSLISVGGLFRFALKTELKLRLFASLSLAVFYDVGDLFEGIPQISRSRTLPDGRVITRTLAQGAGVGLRVATPIGPLAIDMGVPIYDRDRQQRAIQFHFAVGGF